MHSGVWLRNAYSCNYEMLQQPICHKGQKVLYMKAVFIGIQFVFSTDNSKWLIYNRLHILTGVYDSFLTNPLPYAPWNVWSAIPKPCTRGWPVAAIVPFWCPCVLWQHTERRLYQQVWKWVKAIYLQLHLNVMVEMLPPKCT